MSDTAFRPATRGSTPPRKSFSSARPMLRWSRSRPARSRSACVAESLAQRGFGGRGFGMMNRPMGGDEDECLGVPSRGRSGGPFAGRGGDRTRFPGGFAIRRPASHSSSRPAGDLVTVPGGPGLPGGPGTVEVGRRPVPRRRASKKKAGQRSNRRNSSSTRATRRLQRAAARREPFRAERGPAQYSGRHYPSGARCHYPAPSPDAARAAQLHAAGAPARTRAHQ